MLSKASFFLCALSLLSITDGAAALQPRDWHTTLATITTGKPTVTPSALPPCNDPANLCEPEDIHADVISARDSFTSSGENEKAIKRKVPQKKPKTTKAPKATKAPKTTKAPKATKASKSKTAAPTSSAKASSTPAGGSGSCPLTNWKQMKTVPFTDPHAGDTSTQPSASGKHDLKKPSATKSIPASKPSPKKSSKKTPRDHRRQILRTRDEVIDQCKTRGVALWDSLQAKLKSADVQDAPCNPLVAQLEVSRSDEPSTFSRAPQKMGLKVSPYSSFWKIERKSTAPGLNSDYNNYYSPDVGVIVASNIRSPRNKKLFWSQVAGADWVSVINEEGNGKKTSDLQYIYYDYVQEKKSTEPALQHVLVSKGNKKTFTPEQDEFKILAGTVLGEGAMHFIEDFAHTLGRKTVKSISGTWEDGAGGDMLAMWFELEDFAG